MEVEREEDMARQRGTRPRKREAASLGFHSDWWLAATIFKHQARLQ
jgi:hypothetical protein